MGARDWRAWGQLAGESLLDDFERPAGNLICASSGLPGAETQLEQLENGQMVVHIRIPVPGGAISVEESCPQSH